MGIEIGILEGLSVGCVVVGYEEGEIGRPLGIDVGCVGASVGTNDGPVGDSVGGGVGCVGCRLGHADGVRVGCTVGRTVG